MKDYLKTVTFKQLKSKLYKEVQEGRTKAEDKTLWYLKYSRLLTLCLH